MTTASHFASNGNGRSQHVRLTKHLRTSSSATDERVWIAAVAALGWVLLLTVTVLLATGAWSVPGASPAQEPRSADDANPRTSDAAAFADPAAFVQPVTFAVIRPRVAPDVRAAQLARIPRQRDRRSANRDG